MTSKPILTATALCVVVAGACGTATAGDEAEELRRVSEKATAQWEALNATDSLAPTRDAKRVVGTKKTRKSSARAHASALGKDWNDLTTEEQAEIRARVRSRDRIEADASAARAEAARDDEVAKARARNRRAEAQAAAEVEAELAGADYGDERH